MKPKFSLQQRTVYIAGGSKDISDNSLCKKVGDTIKPNSQETVSCTIDVPPGAIYTLNNCDLVSVEYYLKVCKYPLVPHTFLFTMGFLSIQPFIKGLPYEMLITTSTCIAACQPCWKAIKSLAFQLVTCFCDLVSVLFFFISYKP